MSRTWSGWSRSSTVVVSAGILVLTLVLGACTSDPSSEAGPDGPERTTTSAAADGTGAGHDRSATTSPDRTTSTAAPATTIPATTSGGRDPSAFRGAVDGQDGVEVTFTRGAASLTDVRADGLELTCQPLEGGDAKAISVDVAIAEVPLGSGGLVEHTEAGAPYEPTLSGSFTPAGSFAGSLSLSGQRDGYACGGEFTFIATPP